MTEKRITTMAQVIEWMDEYLHEVLCMGTWLAEVRRADVYRKEGRDVPFGLQSQVAQIKEQGLLNAERMKACEESIEAFRDRLHLENKRLQRTLEGPLRRVEMYLFRKGYVWDSTPESILCDTAIMESWKYVLPAAYGKGLETGSMLAGHPHSKVLN